MQRSGWAAPVLAVALLAVSCGAGKEVAPSASDTPTTTTVSAPTTASTGSSEPILAAVNLWDFGPECKVVRCWLPTQFSPRLVKRQSVSLEERTAGNPKGPQAGWPMDGGEHGKEPGDGDKIQVLCVTKGDPYANDKGHSVNDWYRVVVPEDKVEPASREQAQRAPNGRDYLAYVGISWLHILQRRPVPSCDTA